MRSYLLYRLPCCAQCHAVKQEGPWLKTDGTAAKTTEKLLNCSGCLLTRYCNASCQKSNWSAHRVNCIHSNHGILPGEMDKLVHQSACEVQAGKIVLYLDSAKQVLNVEKFPQEDNEGKLVVDVKMNGQLIGSCLYLLCAQLPDALQERIKAAKNLVDDAKDSTMLGIAQDVAALGLYDKAFDLVSNCVVQASSKVNFFRSVVSQMILKNVPHEKIVQLATKIGLSAHQILDEVVVLYAKHDKTPVAFDLAIASDRPSHYVGLIISANLDKSTVEDDARHLVHLLENSTLLDSVQK